MGYSKTELLFLILVGGYLAASPYTKVEESFNIQAIHDMLKYGYLKLQNYDHNEFPGAVPRSFVGALFLSIVMRPFKRFAEDDTFLVQLFLRTFLGLVNAMSLLMLKRSIVNALEINHRSIENQNLKVKKMNEKELANLMKHITGLENAKTTSFWFMILLIIQFHIPYYMSRTLPNFLAFSLTNTAFSFIFNFAFPPALFVFAFAAMVFRSEIFVLLGFIAFILVVSKQIPFKSALVSLLGGTSTGLLISVAVDSYFWQTPMMIPELQGFIYNVIQGQSVNWGSSPVEFYFVDSIPRLLNFGGLGVYLLILAGFLTPDSTPFKLLTRMGYASVLFVSAYSVLLHKEWRFIVYVIPIFTALTAVGITSTANILKSKAGKVGRYLFLGLMGLTAALGLGLSFARFFVSVNNYEGGIALAAFHEHLPRTANPKIGDPIVVHFDVPVAMTGATKFGQIFEDDGSGTGAGRKLEYEPWVVYDKTENPEELEDIADSFDYLIVATPPAEVSDVYPVEEDETWKVLEVVPAVEGYDSEKLKETANSLIKDPVEFLNSAVGSVKEVLNRETAPGEDPFFSTIEGLFTHLYNTLSQYLLARDGVWIYKKVSVNESVEEIPVAQVKSTGHAGHAHAENKALEEDPVQVNDEL